MVTPVYPPYRGGIGEVARRESRALRERGLDVEVFIPTPDKEYIPKDDGVTIVKPFWRNGHTSILPQLFWKLRNVDSIYLHYPFYGAEIFSLLAAVVWRKDLILRYHMQANVRGWRKAVFYIHRLLLEPIIFKASRAVFVSSLDYANSTGVRTGKMREIPFGVDTSLFAPRKTKGNEGVAFLFVGGMDRPHYFKGVPTLLKALATLPDTPWSLTLIGDGELRSSYEDLARTYDVQDRVKFLGSCTQEDLIDEFQKADVHILPSVNQSEAFGLVTLEAAACGSASIVSDLPGVRTLVKDGETGYIVKPGHVGDLSAALIKCLGDRQNVAKMGQEARSMIEQKYSEDKVMDVLFEQYSKITS